MRKKDQILLLSIFILLVLLILSESRQKQINWYPSFAVKHKIPFGSYIAFQEAKKYFGDNFHTVTTGPYQFVKENPDISGTYVIYNSQINLGKTGLEYLFDWIKKGNTVLIASEGFEKSLLDSLQVKENFFFSKSFDKQLILKLLNPNLSTQDSIIFDKKATGTSLRLKNDTIVHNIKALGTYVRNDSLPAYNFIEIPYQKGRILLHTQPYVFTNYFILHGNNAGYFEGILSYINRQHPVYWDVYSQNGASSKGIFKYIIENPGFLWAYRILFIGLFLYVIFEGKRRQRAIPVINPPKNETLNFTQTIAGMYVEGKEDRLIGLMYIKHFYDYVRTKLRLDLRENKDLLQQKIAQKTKTGLKDVEKLFALIEKIENSQKVKPQDIMDLETYLNKIKRNKI